MTAELFAAYDSSDIEDVVEVSETVPAESAPSEIEAFLSSIDENHAFSDANPAYSELITSKFNDVLCTVEKVGRTKSSSVLGIISHYPSVVQPLCRIISCLPSTQVSVKRMFSDLKLVLCETALQWEIM